MIRSRRHGVLFAVLLMLPTTAQANLVINGGFEFPNVGPTGIATFFPGPVQPGFGWTVNSGNVEVAGEFTPSVPGPAFDGAQYLDLNGTDIGSIAQFFSTTPGVTYDMSFAYASNYAHHGESNPAHATVFVTDVGSVTQLVTPFSIHHGSSSASDLDWVVHEIQFTAIGTSTGLGINSESRNTPLGGILLDGVTIVPEPSTGLLLLLGLLLLGLTTLPTPALRRR